MNNQQSDSPEYQQYQELCSSWRHYEVFDRFTAIVLPLAVRIVCIWVLSLWCTGCFDDVDDVILHGDIEIRVDLPTVEIKIHFDERPTIRIANWNIRIFSDNSRDDTEIRMIAEILIDYDFIAIIEIRDERVLMRTESVLQGMGRDYDYLISQPVGATQKERYAFLYDPQIVNVVEDGEVFPDPNDVFLREPYYATFRAGQFDFTVIAVHVVYGNLVGPRQAEVQALAQVFQSVQAADVSEQDVILLGDFNREPNDQVAYAPLLAIPFMDYLFDLPLKSHIRDSSLYDNIFFQTNHVIEYTSENGIERFDETDFGNDDAAANLAVSDHRPVWATFYTDVDDD